MTINQFWKTTYFLIRTEYVGVNNFTEDLRIDLITFNSRFVLSCLDREKGKKKRPKSFFFSFLKHHQKLHTIVANKSCCNGSKKWICVTSLKDGHFCHFEYFITYCKISKFRLS